MSPTSLLAEAVRATAGAPDADALLDRLAAVLARQVDWVLADRLDPPDLVSRVAAYDRAGALVLPEGMGARTSRRSSAGTVGLLPTLERSPSRLLRLDADALRQAARSDDARLALQARTALELGAEEIVVVGLVARDVLAGVLTAGRRRRFSATEVAELTDVAAHAGVALDAVRLLVLQRAVAAALQASLLPPLPSVRGLSLAARYTPAESGLDVGGDWYDAFPTTSGLVVVVGDARGHDLPAVARMADLRNLLRAHAVDRDEPPSAALGRLERTADALGIDAGATCLVGRLTPADGAWALRWSSAGHLPPVLVHDGQAVLLETEAELMLGVQTDAARTDHTRLLVPGDVLVLYTDGLVEQRGSGLAERLELLRTVVQAHGDTSPDGLAERVLADLAAAPGDDVALLVVRVDQRDDRRRSP